MISFDDNSSSDHQDFKSLFPDLYDTNNPLPNFSIRDYVFNSRNKDIACNWPFSQKTLQICLKHGVKNLLPPFESLESLRNNSSNEEIIGGFDGNSNPELTSDSMNTTNRSKEDKESQEDIGQQKSKKSVLVSSRKLNTSVDQIEEVTHMASKVCPVCKTYSSSSNTALNSHIDQCLSGESSMKCTANPKVNVNHSIKPRIKPRKMRLMSDIYKTAPHCTVEELDARNGRTSWANNSSFPAQELEFQGEEEKNATNIVPVVSDHEGDVYIDNNGTKFRILSVPKVDTSNGHGARKLLKRGKSSKIFTGRKKNKHLKLSPSDKKLCSQNPSKVKTAREENDDIKESYKVDRVEEVMNREDYLIVRPPWACSKRTVLAKKLRANLRIPPPLRKPTSSDSCLVKRSNVRPKGSKFLSSTKKLLSVSRDPISKFNLKRKFSALKKSSVHSLSKQKVVVGPSQDSSKRVEEDTSGITSFMRTNFLEVGKNKKTKISIPESSNGDSTEIVNLSSCDVESARKETRSHNEQVDVAGSSMDLSTSLNLESLNDKEMNCADLIKNNASTDNIEADIEMQEINIQVVDPILVSKSPTESCMVSEEQGDSSLVSEEQHYYDMSDSPISMISNPILARSDSDKFSIRLSTSLKDDTRDFSGAINDKYAPIISTSAFKNDHYCCCSRKEPASSQTIASKKRAIESFNFTPQMFSVSSNPTSQPPPPLLETLDSSLPMKLAAYNECDSVGSPSKPVLRLMGKNLTVVNTNDQELNYGQFPNVVNEQKFPSNHTLFGNTTYADYFSNPHVGPMIPQDRAHEDRNRFDDQRVINEMNMHKLPSNSINEPIIIDDSPENDHNYTPLGYQSQSAMAFSNDGFQACFPFGKWYRTPTSGSSRSSAI